ncbi:acyl-CoA thioesterase [Agarilytica rhodophyticola]|uniref:acyl-CoA thioesterase n=1 Tax=Agarilytica rhodophyticola TaxID=1737490 RepID=UPI000B341AB9|nr:acyl-CoA thioesterase [Agarilytica rhodophyticola]
MISENYYMEVPFFDVDSMHIAWHGHYCKYIELARCKLLEKIGYSYQDMASSGYSFPIVDMRIKYVNPLTFGQQITIKATLMEWQVRLKISYVICDSESEQKLTQAHTVQAAVNNKTGIMQLQCPQVLTDRVNACL